jgi:hypothetical protein
MHTTTAEVIPAATGTVGKGFDSDGVSVSSGDGEDVRLGVGLDVGLWSGVDVGIVVVGEGVGVAAGVDVGVCTSESTVILEMSTGAISG